MNTQERDQLNQFLKQLIEVKLTEKNTEAETMIREAAARQPDAAYLLVQRSLLLEQALNEANTKISALQNPLQQNSSAASTGHFFGNDPWAQAPSKANAVPGAGSNPIPAASAGAGNAPFSHVAPQTTGSGVGSFLGNVATTAAGVVAGSFLFQGIENLMGGHHQSGWGQQPLGEQMTENTVINNYYGDSDQPETTSHSNDFMASNESDSFFEDNGGFFDDSGNDDSDWA